MKLLVVINCTRAQDTCFSLQVGGLARGMNAMSASRLDEYDFDARLEAYNTASKALPCPLPPSPAAFLRTKAASPAQCRLRAAFSAIAGADPGAPPG
jgi:hypothetical protein